MEREPLLERIETFAAARGIQPQSVTKAAVSNRKLYGRLKAGGECYPSTAKAVLDYIAAQEARGQKSAA